MGPLPCRILDVKVQMYETGRRGNVYIPNRLVDSDLIAEMVQGKVSLLKRVHIFSV